MKVERKNFIERLEALEIACNESLLINTVDPLHNEIAKQLRSGLCVMVFSALEEFIRVRVENVLQMLIPASLPFDYLPEKLRIAATIGALQGIMFQQKLQSDDKKSAFLLEQFRLLASLSDQNYRISKYAFVHSGSNVQPNEITTLLEALSIEKPWETIYHTAKRLKLATANPSKAEFERLSSFRHRAAHDQSFDIPNFDLVNCMKSALSIGLALDTVITSAIRNLNSSLATHGEIKELKSKSISIYFVSTKALKKRFRLEKEGIKKAISTNIDIQIIKSAAIQKLKADVGVVILHDGSFKPKEWFCES